MFEEMSRVGLPAPVYSQPRGAASLRVILLADPLTGRILDRLPSGSERFVEFLSRGGRVTTTQAVELLGLSRPTVLNHLHELVAHGLLEHVGTSLKDPRGYWRPGGASRPQAHGPPQHQARSSAFSLHRFHDSDSSLLANRRPQAAVSGVLQPLPAPAPPARRRPCARRDDIAAVTSPVTIPGRWQGRVGVVRVPRREEQIQ